MAGLSHRLANAPAGPAREAASVFAEQGRSALRRQAWVEAREALLAAHEQLDAVATETELREFPRGLVGYVPRGDRGVPVGAEEDPVANRLRLALRLATVLHRDGIPTERIEERLREAETQFDAGDRAAAVRTTNEALGLIERARRTPTGSESGKAAPARREP